MSYTKITGNVSDMRDCRAVLLELSVTYREIQAAKGRTVINKCKYSILDNTTFEFEVPIEDTDNERK